MSAVATVEMRVRDVLASLLPNRDAAGAIETSAPLRASGLDSFRALELITALETEFAIRIEEDDLRDDYFASIDGLLLLLASKERS